jgi:hypothetical protein
MAESETVNIEGNDYELAAVEAALNQVEDDNGNVQGGVAVVDGIAIAGDSDNDSFVRIARAEDVDIVPRDDFEAGYYDFDGHEYVYTSSVRSQIEDATEPTFVEYLEDIEGVDGSNEFGEPYEAPVSLGSADAYIAYRFLSGDEMKTIVDDDGTRIAKTKADDDETVYVGVEDAR